MTACTPTVASPTEDGRARLLYTAPLPLPEPPDDEYPILLNTGRTVEHWHTRTKTRDVPMLEKLSPEPWVEIHPQTARRFRLGPRNRVSLVSRRDALRLAAADYRDDPPRPSICAFHFAEQCVNQLTLPAFCPKSREPNYKQCAVRIERVEKPPLNEEIMKAITAIALAVLSCAEGIGLGN